MIFVKLLARVKMKCFVSTCSSDFHGYKYLDDAQQKSFSKHRFPHDPERRIAWLESIASAGNKVHALNEINFDSVRICSRHFNETDFYYKNGKKCLNKTATPVIFEGVPDVARRTRDVSSGRQVTLWIPM